MSIKKDTGPDYITTEMLVSAGEIGVGELTTLMMYSQGKHLYSEAYIVGGFSTII